MKKAISKGLLSVFLCLLVIVLLLYLLPTARSADAKTVANDGKFYSDYLTHEDTVAAGRKANEEIASEGITLLKNRNNLLPLKGVKRVSVFGKNSADPFYHGTAAGSDQSTLVPVSLYDGLEEAGFEVNQILASFYGNENRSGNTRAIGQFVGETPLSMYDNAVKRSFASYDDAAFICISRSSTESADPVRTFARDSASDPEDEAAKGRHYLELSPNERALIQYVKDLGFDKIIVLINSANIFEVGDLMEDEAIDGLLWVSAPGVDGFRALGQILTGEVNPSGHVVDTWYRDFTKDPTFYNFGNNAQASANGKTAMNYYIDAETGKPLEGMRAKSFVQYEEDIYVGYRYYETMYADMVAGDGKTAADAWYAENVVFPFGYGLSYTDFTVTKVVPSIEENTDLRSHATGKISFDVTVKNTGNVAGKDVVQLYYHAPYIDGGIEKAEENLGAFAKTDLLAPGEEQTLTLEIYIQDMASYDFEDKNGNRSCGYELDPGRYDFCINSDAHTAFKSAEGVQTKLTYQISGEESIQYENDRITGQKVENRFDSTQDPETGEIGPNDYNSLPDPVGSVKMERMTRASENHLVTPKAPTTEEATISKDGPLYKKITTMFELKDLTEDDFYWRDEKQVTIGGETVTRTQAASAEDRTIELKFTDMIGVDSDDIRWEKFLNQLTWEEMVDVVSEGRFQSPGVPAVDWPDAWTNNGPIQIQDVDYGSEPLLAATWNVELAALKGRMIGNEALWIGLQGWYGPACNIHRSAFGARNHEYFSEDGYLSGAMVAREIAAAQEKGLYVMVKHFALNEQETDRAGIATYASEQAIREIYLVPFRMAVEEGKALGLMTAMNKIGDTANYGNYALCMDILRGEWGFNGIIITDAGGAATVPVATTEQFPVMAIFVNLWQERLAGNDLSLINSNAAGIKYYGEWDAAKQTVIYTPDEGEPVDATSLWLAVRDSVKRLAFVNAQSNLLKNGVDVSEFSGQEKIDLGVGVEFSMSLALESEVETKDIRYYISAGELPGGVTLSNEGILSGTPTEAGRFDVTLTLQADTWVESSKQCVITVSPSAKANNLSDLKVGTAVTDASISSDFIYVGYKRVGVLFPDGQSYWVTQSVEFEIVSGALPDGLTMAADGTVTGTPTTAGTYDFTVNIKVTEEADLLPNIAGTPVSPNYYTAMTLVVGESGGSTPAPTPNPETPPEEEGGCGSVAGISGVAAAGVLLLAGAAVLFLLKKSRTDR